MTKINTDRLAVYAEWDTALVPALFAETWKRIQGAEINEYDFYGILEKVMDDYDRNPSGFWESVNA